MLIDYIIATGMKYRGTPYLFNAPSMSTDHFDCSSFIQYIFMENGILLPRNSREQSLVGYRVSPKKLRKGDLLFFMTKKRMNRKGISKIGHVGLYLGKGKMLHTFRPENKVTITELDSKWSARFVLAKRLV